MLCQVAELSARLVVMSERARTFLRDVYDVPDAKIDLIAHGIPDMPFVDPNFYKDQFGVEGKFVALTFGLLSPNKGIELMLRAMPAILKEFPNFVYIVLGATHPNLIREQGERYRISLERLAKDLGIKPNVSFYNRFVEIDELIEFIGMADIYVTPYLNPAQITSGTLAYSFGCGKAVVSTPYWYAEELLADGRGVLVPFGDSKALAREICELLARRAAAARHAEEGLHAGPRDDLEPCRSPLHGIVPAGAAEPARHAVQAAGGPHPGGAADGSARLAARPSGADDRLGRHAPARQLDDSQLRRGLLHRRQRPRPAADRPAGTARPELGAGPPAGDDLRRVPELRLRPRAEPVPQFPGVRPPLARGGRLGRLPRPGALGAGGLRRPVAAARPSVLGLAALRPGAADDHRDDLAAGLGLRLDRRLPVPPAVQRRPAGQPGARHA